LAAPSRKTWDGRRDHALPLVTVQTGVRLSEVTGLRREDVVQGLTSALRVKVARSGARH
jgi:integrase